MNFPTGKPQTARINHIVFGNPEETSSVPPFWRGGGGLAPELIIAQKNTHRGATYSVRKPPEK